jgi:hypothetical protein
LNNKRNEVAKFELEEAGLGVFSKWLCSTGHCLNSQDQSAANNPARN